MNELETQIVETWGIHQRTMMHFLKNLPEGALSATMSTRGGRDVARQLAHCHNVRAVRLKATARREGLDMPEFDPKESPDLDTLITAFELTGDVMELHIAKGISDAGRCSNFKRGVVPMIGYYISHETHHRGHVMATLRHCGIKVPHELGYGIWDWNKI